MAKHIITAHNAFIEGVYSTAKVQQQPFPLTRFLPEEPAKVYTSELNDNSNCIVGNSERLVTIPWSTLCIISFAVTSEIWTSEFTSIYSLLPASMASMTFCSWSVAAITHLLTMFIWSYSSTHPPHPAYCRQWRLLSSSLVCCRRTLWLTSLQGSHWFAFNPPPFFVYHSSSGSLPTVLQKLDVQHSEWGVLSLSLSLSHFIKSPSLHCETMYNTIRG